MFPQSAMVLASSLLDECERYAEKDDRVKIKRYDDLVYPGTVVHAFYVK